MNFSVSAIMAGFVFGVFGLYLMRYGKKEAHLPSILIGISLMAYPYFVESEVLLWGIGIGLLLLAYKQR